MKKPGSLSQTGLRVSRTSGLGVLPRVDRVANQNIRPSPALNDLTASASSSSVVSH